MPGATVPCSSQRLLPQVVDKSDDNKLTAEEFKSALPNLKKWGVDISEEDADATFASIDTDKGGAVMFDEFADWAYKHKLDLEVNKRRQPHAHNTPTQASV